MLLLIWRQRSLSEAGMTNCKHDQATQNLLLQVMKNCEQKTDKFLFYTTIVAVVLTISRKLGLRLPSSLPPLGSTKIVAPKSRAL